MSRDSARMSSIASADSAAGAVRTCDPGDAGGCALCGDEALPARVLDVRANDGLATVTMLVSGATSLSVNASIDVAIDLVDGVSIGDVVLVHQGFVISRVGAP